MRPAVSRRTPICLKCQSRLIDDLLRVARPTAVSSLKRSFTQASNTRERTQLRYSRNDTEYLGLKALRARSSDEDQTQSKTRHTVGAPKEYIVLRNEPRPSRLGQQDGAQNPDATGKESMENGIGNQLEEIPGLSDQNEINNNINSIRPQKQNGTIPKGKYNNLVGKLRKGFTKKQLWQYIQQYGGSQAESIGMIEKPTQLQSPSILECLTWRRGLKDFDTRLHPVHDLAASPLLYKEKFVLSDHILRRCWGLEHEEHTAVEGQLEIVVNVKQFAQFMSSSRQMIRNLVNNHQARIETAASEGRIRISGTKDNAEWVVREIDGALQTPSELEIDTAMLQRIAGPGRYSRAMEMANLDRIASLTGTVIKSDKERHRIIIQHSRQNTKAAEDARRLIFASTDWTTLPHRELISGRGFLGSPEKLETPPDLSWAQRMEKWAILRSVDESGQCSHLEDHHKIDKGIIKQIDEYLNPSDPEILSHRTLSPDVEVRALHHHRPNEARWRFNPLHVTSAEFGRVLIPLQESTSKSDTDSTRTKNYKDWTFSSYTPGISQLASKSDMSSPSTAAVKIKLRPFAAIDASYTDGLDKAPPLEIVLTRTRQLYAPARSWMLHAVLDSRVLGLILPTAQADLRFEKRTLLIYQKAKESATLRQFLKQCQLDVFGKNRLQTPSSITIPIPKMLLGTHSPSTAAKEFDTIDVEYLVAGLEYSEYTPFKHNHATFQFIQKEGGRIGGRGARIRFARKSSAIKDGTPSTDLATSSKLSSALGEILDRSQIAKVRAIEKQGSASLVPFEEFFNNAYHFALGIDKQIPSLASAMKAPSLGSDDSQLEIRTSKAPFNSRMASK